VSRRARVVIAVAIAACVIVLGWLLLADRTAPPPRDLRRALELPQRGPRKVNEALEKHRPGSQPRSNDPPRAP
jgi:hypothetical protein